MLQIPTYQLIINRLLIGSHAGQKQAAQCAAYVVECLFTFFMLDYLVQIVYNLRVKLLQTLARLRAKHSDCEYGVALDFVIG